MSKVRLTSNQYGKAENRLMRVYRDSERHELRDLNVTSQLWGDFETAHTKATTNTSWPLIRRRTRSSRRPGTGRELAEQFIMAG